jgi:hypothetical protein
METDDTKHKSIKVNGRWWGASSRTPHAPPRQVQRWTKPGPNLDRFKGNSNARGGGEEKQRKKRKVEKEKGAKQPSRQKKAAESEKKGGSEEGLVRVRHRPAVGFNRRSPKNTTETPHKPQVWPAPPKVTEEKRWKKGWGGGKREQHTRLQRREDAEGTVSRAGEYWLGSTKLKS